MAIRFYCQRCGQLLSIASRKAGTIIECPKCSAGQEVPSQEAADAAMSLAAASEGAEKPGNLSANTVHDEYILLSRRAIYMQGALFVVVGVLALGMGYLIGRGGVMEKAPDADGPSDSAAADPVLIEGRLTFETANGETRPDRDAAIIVLPERIDAENDQDDKRIASPGIRALDSPPPQDYGSLRQIRAEGGCYARADENGGFSIVLPDSGRYHLLLISRGATRPDGSAVDAADLEFLASRFRRPGYLVGEQDYRLSLEKFEGRAQIEHVFVHNPKR